MAAGAFGRALPSGPVRSVLSSAALCFAWRCFALLCLLVIVLIVSLAPTDDCLDLGWNPEL